MLVRTCGVGLILVVASGAALLNGGCSNSASAGPREVSASELQTMMIDGQPILLLDVRTASEYATGHIPGSANTPLDDLATWSQGLDKAARICTICASGHRSLTAATALVNQGFTNVASLKGGVNQWPGTLETN